VVEALVKAGAFDLLHADRAAVLASVAWPSTGPTRSSANVAAGRPVRRWATTHGSSSTQEPALVPSSPGTIRERLQQEKAALGFYLSGHLFDAWADEVRRFCAKRPIADLVDSREPQLVAGIVDDARWVNGRSGRVMIFRLSDGSEAIEVVVGEEALDAEQREWLREDELLVLQGKAQHDRFSGGLRLAATQVWNLAAARARFGRWLALEVGERMPGLAELVRGSPARRVDSEHGERVQGLPVRLALRRSGACAQVDLGDEARIWPSDDALLRWRAAARDGRAEVVYEAG
jgi:DNA polymerase-3 subunit alpha